ncbi:MAG: pseudouridine synthase, partial [Pirellulaceae bacterium]
MTKASKRVVVHPQAPDPARRLVNVVASAMRRQPTQARRHILAGNVGVNLNITRKPDRILKPGDIVDIFPEEEKVKVPKVKSVPFPKKLLVIYEDSQLLVVDKPAGLLSVPTTKGDRKTMLSLVELYLQEEDPNAEVYSLQRLDRDVSGVMLFAKDETTYLKLREQFEANKPSRKYVAIIAGQLKTETGTFRTYLATGKNLKRYSVKNEKEGELAIT